MTVKFGIFPPQGWKMDLMAISDPVEQYAAMTAVAREADKGAWDSIWVFDHFHTVPEPTMNTTFECWTITSTLARDTERVKIGQMVACNGYRNPALSAKIASTVDVASKGRLLFGYGGGWYEHEWRAYGYGFPETGPRMRMFREGVEIIHKMLTEDKPKFDGEFYSIDEPINEPKSHKPGYKIPLWIGGGGEKVTLKLVAQYGDACNVFFDVITEKLEILKRHCDDVGRDYDEITKSSGIDAYVIPKGADPVQATATVREKYYDGETYESFKNRYIVADADTLVERVALMRDKGIQYIVVDIAGIAYDHDPMHRFAEDVIPVFS
jgi:F420-dependent oxidoreductase-like protein